MLYESINVSNARPKGSAFITVINVGKELKLRTYNFSMVSGYTDLGIIMNLVEIWSQHIELSNV